MKSVVQIQRQGKVKNVRASAAASGLPTEEIDSTVALIQALIPLGLQAVESMQNPGRLGCLFKVSRAGRSKAGMPLSKCLLQLSVEDPGAHLQE